MTVVCSVGRANVFSFGGDVFTLAGQVFSFGWGASPRFRRLRGEMTRGNWLVGDGEWLVTKVGVGLLASGGEPGPGMGDGGSDGNAINAGTACVAGSAGNAGGDGVVSDGLADRGGGSSRGSP